VFHETGDRTGVILRETQNTRCWCRKTKKKKKKKNHIASFEALKVATFQVEFFWVVTPCSVVVGYGGSMDLWNAGTLPQHYTGSRSRRPRLEYLRNFKLPYRGR
jgi:hypothetical protein